MDRILLAASTVCFLMGFAYSMYALGARMVRPARFNLVVMLLGFLLQTGFLHQRGQTVGRCPLTNMFEILVFLSWALVLLYFIVGPTYRLSLLGTFTSPLVFIILTFAQSLPSAALQPEYKPASGFWPEMHAAISLIAYGAFALACVAGVMYLVQERSLKRHRMNSFLFNLPPIADLAVALHRVLLVGFALLTLGLAAGFNAGNLDEHRAAIIWSVCVWLMYGTLLLLRFTRRFSSRHIALLSVIAFTVALTTLWVIIFKHL